MKTTFSPRELLVLISGLVADEFGLRPEDLWRHTREQPLVRARQMVFYLAREHTPLTLITIAHHFKMHYGSVAYGWRTVRAERRIYKAVDALTVKLGEKMASQQIAKTYTPKYLCCPRCGNVIEGL